MSPITTTAQARSSASLRAGKTRSGGRTSRCRLRCCGRVRCRGRGALAGRGRGLRLRGLRFLGGGGGGAAGKQIGVGSESIFLIEKKTVLRLTINCLNAV